MGFLHGSLTYTTYQVEGDLSINYMEQMFEALLKNRFIPFEEIEFAESTLGWVSPHNFLHHHFTMDKVFPTNDHLLVSLRLDKKTVPAKVLKAMLPDKEQEYLQETGKEKLTRDDKIFVKEQVRRTLLRQQFPSSQVWDVLYDIPAGRVFFGATALAANDLFSEFFKKTFERPIHLMSPEWRMQHADLTSSMSWALEHITPETFGANHGQ
ncbi:recombination-associated protein RdgC [Chrysiogenes arsenatis]|uniref:recombination-associated protein RdgC n=1 Tax=Chrysiogenes arsenatis TaxID=309797 RepID=UPI000407A7A1|nr:recombination-associated protein RdgC [Chrysiogenes arsenatis]